MTNSQSNPPESKKENISNQHILHSSTVTPPIPEGKILKYAAMSDAGLENMITLTADDSKDFHGIYAGGIADCVAVTIVERDTQGKITQLSMIHCAGGLNKARLDCLMQSLQELPKGAYRELVITAGNTNKSIEQFKQSLTLWLGGNDIDIYLKEQYPNLRFEESKYTFVPCVEGSACVTFDGYAGPFYGNSEATRTKKATPAPRLNLIDERKEFERLKMDNRLDSKAIDRVKNAIESAGCNDQVRAQLYFYTREIIFKTKFNSDIQNSKDQKPVESQVITQAIENYKRQISELPLFTKKEIILSAVLTVVFAGTPLLVAIPYFICTGIQRVNARKGLKEEFESPEKNKKRRT